MEENIRKRRILMFLRLSTGVTPIHSQHVSWASIIHRVLKGGLCESTALAKLSVTGLRCPSVSRLCWQPCKVSSNLRLNLNLNNYSAVMSFRQSSNLGFLFSTFNSKVEAQKCIFHLYLLLTKVLFFTKRTLFPRKEKIQFNNPHYKARRRFICGACDQSGRRCVA